MGKVFVHRLQTTKSTKILPLENYPLYGTQQMIEGKLEEEGYQPRNVQVRITEEEGYYSKIELLDSEGLEVVNHREEEESPEASGDESDHSSVGSARAGDQDLESRLQEAEARNEELTREMSKIRVELGEANECIKELWEQQCAQLVEADCQLVEAEAEIALLRRQLARSTPCPPAHIEAPTGVQPVRASTVSQPLGSVS